MAHLKTSAAIAVCAVCVTLLSTPRTGGISDATHFLTFLGLVCGVSFLTSFLVLRLMHHHRTERVAVANRAPAADAVALATWDAVLDQEAQYEHIFEAPAETGAVQAEKDNLPSAKPADDGRVPFDSRPSRVRSKAPVRPALQDVALTGIPASAETPDVALAVLAQEAVEYAQGNLIDIDDFVRFGLQLFLMGAAGELARRKGWTEAQGQHELAAASVVLGATPGRAEDYAISANAFAQVDAFRFLIEGGIEAIRVRLDEGRDDLETLPALLSSWHLIQNDVQLPSLHTALVMSVNVKPNDGAVTPPDIWRSITRSHKNFTEESIAASGGKVVQEIATGVALSFEDPEIAIRTAILLQEQSHVWVRSWTQYTISIEIGIDTALGLHAGGNLVSVAQSRAARLLRLTRPNQILCTAAVKVASVGADIFTAEAFGERAEGLPPLFSINWARTPNEHVAAVEYRHIGTAGADGATTTPDSKALENWLTAESARST